MLPLLRWPARTCGHVYVGAGCHNHREGCGEGVAEAINPSQVVVVVDGPALEEFSRGPAVGDAHAELTDTGLGKGGVQGGGNAGTRQNELLL